MTKDGMVTFQPFIRPYITVTLRDPVNQATNHTLSNLSIVFRDLRHDAHLARGQPMDLALSAVVKQTAPTVDEAVAAVDVAGIL